MKPHNTPPGARQPAPIGLFAVGAAGAWSFFAELLENTPAPIYVLSRHGRYLFVNRAWEKVAGVPRRRAVGKTGAEVFPADTARHFRESEQQVFSTGAPIRLEEVVETKRGPRRYYTVKFPVRGRRGRVVAVGGISIEITGRRRAEAAARTAEARSRELLEASPDGIIVVRDLRLAYANQAYCDLLGYADPADLLGRGPADLLADTCRERVTGYTLDRVRGLPAPTCFEVEYLHRDGRAVPTEVHVRRIDFDGAPASLVYVRDIRGHKEAEKALRESEARMRCFFEAAFEAIVLHERGTILDANQAAADLLGYAAPELIGRSALEFSPPEFRPVVRDRFTSDDEGPYESVGLRRDGSTFPGEVRARTLRCGDRTIRVTALRDLTERKAAEQALRDYTGRLQELSRRLLAVQEEERRRIARELHDEVGQLLTGLSLTLERGERAGADGLREAVGEARGLLRDLTGLVRDLSQRLRPTMLDDLGLLPALLGHFQRYTAQTGVRVDFRHAGLGVRMSPEGETAAYRIVQEALTNVARHAGVPEASVEIALDGGTLRLTVADRGPGFDVEAAARGGGFGLAGMRQRAALLGGRLTLTSAADAGTCVAAEWPEKLSEG